MEPLSPIAQMTALVARTEDIATRFDACIDEFGEVVTECERLFDAMIAKHGLAGIIKLTPILIEMRYRYRALNAARARP